MKYFLIARSFHATGKLMLDQQHPLFRMVDWTLIESGQYCVVDPVNTGSVLHVSYQDYLVLVRVALSNGITLKVLAGPGESRPLKPAKGFTSPNDPSSQNSPPLDDRRFNHLLMDFFFPKGIKKSYRSSRKGAAVRAVLQSELIPFGIMTDAGTWMVKLTNGNIGKWLTVWHNRLHWYSRGTVPGAQSSLEVSTFGLFLRKLLKSNGINHVIQRFKISLFVVNAYLGGRRLDTTAPLGFRIRLSNGLPAFLPLRVREGIRFGNLHYIHIWTSVLNSYKGLLGTWPEPRLDKGSIAQEHPKLQTTVLYQWGIFCRWLWRAIQRKHSPKPINFRVKSPFFTTKAGPNSPNSILGAGMDAYLWYALDRKQPSTAVSDPKTTSDTLSAKADNDPAREIRQHVGVSENLIKLWLLATGQKTLERQIRMTAKMFSMQFNLSSLISKPWEKLLNKQLGEYPPTPHNKAARNWLTSCREFWTNFMGENNRMLRFKHPTLSKLHNLYEAAGKVRTIAIVDYWTNFVLKPLHDWMFDILTLLPQDATFNQEGRVEEFASRGYSEVFSYDLKSATDLIPLTLYKYLFGFKMPRGILEIWLRLLVDRSFRVPLTVLKAHPGHPETVRYKTGQPMGALTSWASMAILHHFLVLFAAYRANVVGLHNMLEFIDYLVLGDDIVIANAKVAQAYVELCKALHIPIGLAKSHISTIGMFNFANQTFVDRINISPISMKEDINAKGLLARIALVMRMARRGWKDMESRSWLSHLLRGLTNSVIWNNAIVPLARVRGTVPILHWIVASTLLPGTSRFGYTGLSVDPRLLLSTYVQKARVWTTSLRNLTSLSFSSSEQPLLSLFTARWVDSIYQQFLTNRLRLKEFDAWVTRAISVDIEWLFKLIFEDERTKANENWALKFRLPLKEVQVATKLSGVNTIQLLEAATGKNLDELFEFIAKAEAEIPLIPDFNESTLSAIFPKDEGGVPSRDAALKRAQLQAMLRVASLLVMLEQLPQDPNRPGTVPGSAPKDYQSLESFLSSGRKKP